MLRKIYSKDGRVFYYRKPKLKKFTLNMILINNYCEIHDIYSHAKKYVYSNRRYKKVSGLKKEFNSIKKNIKKHLKEKSPCELYDIDFGFIYNALAKWAEQKYDQEYTFYRINIIFSKYDELFKAIRLMDNML